MLEIKLDERKYAAFKEVLGGEHPDIESVFGRLSVQFNQDLIAESAVQYILSPDYQGDAKKVVDDFRLRSEHLRDAAERLYPRELWPSVIEALAKEVPGLESAGRVDLISRALERGLMLEGRRDYDQAIHTLERLHRVAPPLIGPGHELMIRIEERLASLYELLERLEDAEPLRRELVDRHSRLGRHTPDFARSMDRLGMLLLRMNRIDEARKTISEVVELERMRGEERLDFGRALSNLAAIERAAGNDQEAGKNYLGGAEVFKILSGTKHPGYIPHLLLAAESFRLSRDLDAAEDLYVRAVTEDWEGDRFGEGVKQGLDGLHKVSGSYLGISRFDDAVRLRKSISGTMRAILGEESRAYCVSLARLAQAHELRGDLKKAEEILSEVLSIAAGVPGGADQFAIASGRIGMICVADGRYAEARVFLRDAQRVHAALGKDRPAYADSVHRLAILEAAMGNFSESEELLIEAREVLRPRGEDRPEYAAILKNLGLFYCLIGKNEKSSDFFDEAILIHLRLSEDRLGLAHVIANYALTKLATGDFKSAYLMYANAERLYLETIGPDHPVYREFQKWLDYAKEYVDRKEPPIIKFDIIKLMMNSLLAAA